MERLQMFGRTVSFQAYLIEVLRRRTQRMRGSAIITWHLILKCLRFRRDDLEAFDECLQDVHTEKSAFSYMSYALEEKEVTAPPQGSLDTVRFTFPEC